MSKGGFQIPKWVKKAWGFEEDESGIFSLLDKLRIACFTSKHSFFINDLKEHWDFTSFLYQDFLDKSILEGDCIVFNKNTIFEYPHYLKRLIWLFDPKRAIVEICVDYDVPMIISNPDHEIVLVLAPRVREMKKIKK